ncbi:hypothetical protein I552_9119 [Mycobacterium xenopi 3993]|nr:hypothetical protein I552_9119 [Mycobacterium xenopi 3993]
MRFAVLAAVTGIGFLIVAALWVSTCKGAMAVDTVACGAPQRALLAFGAPAILLAAGVWAFIRTYRVWRDRGTWWGWQGAGWFLLMLMLLTLTMGHRRSPPGTWRLIRRRAGRSGYRSAQPAIARRCGSPGDAPRSATALR